MLDIQLKTLSGDKIQLIGLSKNKGVIWVNWDDQVNHILISDLDEESKLKVETLLADNPIP